MKKRHGALLAALGVAVAWMPPFQARAGDAVPCVFAAKGVPEKPGDASKAIAQATVRAWIECLGDRQIVIPKTRLRMVLEQRDPGGNAAMPYHLAMRDGPIHLTIGLKRRIRSSMSAKDINASIDFIANDGFPMPGLDVRHWQLRGLTRSSHPQVEHAVLAVDQTGIVLEMAMEIFSIYGRDTRERVIPDKPTERHAYLSMDLVRPLKVIVRLDIESFHQ